MADPNDLARFLSARLDEREALARRAAEEAGAENWAGGIGGGGGEVTTDKGTPIATHVEMAADAEHEWIRPTVALFMTYNDPAHVLAEIAAVRKVIARFRLLEEILPAAWQTYRDMTEGFPPLPTPVPVQPSDEGLRTGLVFVMRELAAPYADHADYDEAFRP